MFTNWIPFIFFTWWPNTIMFINWTTFTFFTCWTLYDHVHILNSLYILLMLTLYDYVHKLNPLYVHYVHKLNPLYILHMLTLYEHRTGLKIAIITVLSVTFEQQDIFTNCFFHAKIHLFSCISSIFYIICFIINLYFLGPRF